MINLLPPQVKENITYARHNTRLLHWIIALFIGILGIVGTVAIGHMYLRQSTSSYASLVKAGQENLKQQQLEETQLKVRDITDSLKLATQVLQREILFSKLLAQTGAVLPSGSVLTGLSINQVQGGIDIQAAAVDYQTATQVLLNLQDPENKIFEKADIVNIQCAPAGGSTDPISAKYPCSIQIRALFAKNNSFSFISSGSSAQ